jgi:hypothetical protein
VFSYTVVKKNYRDGSCLLCYRYNTVCRFRVLRVSWAGVADSGDFSMYCCDFAADIIPVQDVFMLWYIVNRRIHLYGAVLSVILR